MSLKRKFLNIIQFSLIFIPVIFSFLYFYLPVFITSYIIPQLAVKAKEAGIEDLSCNIRRIGLTGADFGAISVGRQNQHALSVGSLQIDYTPKSIYQKEIDKIIFSGAELYCGVKNGKFFLRGVDIEKIFPRRTEKKESSEFPLPVSIGSLEFHNSQVIFQRDEKEYRIPFDLLLIPKIQEKDSWKILQADLILYPLSQKIALKSSIDLTDKKANLILDASSVLIERFSDFAELLTQEEPVLSGELDIKAEASLKFDPFKIISLSAESEFRNHGTALKTFRLGKAPLQIKIIGKETGEWNLSAASLSLSEPFPLQIQSVKIRLNIPEKKNDKIIAYDVNIYDIKSGDKSLKIPSLALRGEFETASLLI